MYSVERTNKQTNRYARDILYSQLLAGVDEADLLDLDALLLLEGLLDGQDLVLGLEVEGLLAAGEGLDENLRGGWTRPPMSGCGGGGARWAAKGYYI